MQQHEDDSSDRAYIVWEVNTRGRRGRKSGRLSLGEARLLRLTLPTITGRVHCTYEIEPADQGQNQTGEM